MADAAVAEPTVIVRRRGAPRPSYPSVGSPPYARAADSIMTFLSGVTLGAVVLVQKSAIAWSSDASARSIQLRPVECEVMESNIRTSIALAEATPGVAAGYVLSPRTAEAARAWLGTGLDLSTLAFPGWSSSSSAIPATWI